VSIVSVLFTFIALTCISAGLTFSAKLKSVTISQTLNPQVVSAIISCHRAFYILLQSRKSR